MKRDGLNFASMTSQDKSGKMVSSWFWSLKLGRHLITFDWNQLRWLKFGIDDVTMTSQ